MLKKATPKDLFDAIEDGAVGIASMELIGKATMSPEEAKILRLGAMCGAMFLMDNLEKSYPQYADSFIAAVTLSALGPDYVDGFSS